jgi:hypothetical protein
MEKLKYQLLLYLLILKLMIKQESFQHSFMSTVDEEIFLAENRPQAGETGAG